MMATRALQKEDDEDKVPWVVTAAATSTITTTTAVTTTATKTKRGKRFNYVVNNMILYTFQGAPQKNMVERKTNVW